MQRVAEGEKALQMASVSKRRCQQGQQECCIWMTLPQASGSRSSSSSQPRCRSWLQNGYRIKVGLTNVETVGIDTPEDLERAEQFLKELKD